ncbi:MAG: undecaprenyl-diphosphate phosphatase [Gammaproteobacteria bacterium]|nr:undecaprenyl-diphosphate phosphatase [Gammaproteobacteria bacterium]
MDILQVVVLAVVQGLTEFLPISSSAHLVLVSYFAGWSDQGLAFDTAVHLGSLVAVLVYFRRELAGIAGSTMHLRRDASTALLGKLAVATVPVVVAGAVGKPWIETVLRSTDVIATATIAFALALWWADRRRGAERDEHDLTFSQAALIGVAQAMALVPGTSRAGITITAALLLGLSRQGAARFSFLLAIPAIAGAALLSAADAATGGDTPPWDDLALGFALSGLCAYGCIAAFIRLLHRTGMTPYVLYRIALGALLLLLL